MKKKIFSFLPILTALLLGGCGSDPKVEYEDPYALNTLTTDIDLPDVYMISSAMVDSMLVSPATVQITLDQRPILIVSKIENRTDQHLDTNSITDSIRTQLIRSGKFRFTDGQSRDAQLDEIDFQKNSGVVSQEKAIQMGQQYGAQYMVTGAIVSYVTGNEKQRRKAYKFTMNLINLESGIIEWADEKPIVKSITRSKVGR